ncbi:hypothetical protein CspHIS471_0610690 [Cutaneotrichosporon sp. HIS471]|nr:hypothetical protein CspHIS471_0610690 [Cutaneotrichosporon sp. HIS471]
MAVSKSPRLSVHISLVALALILFAQPSHATYNYFSFEYNITDISPLFKWGIPNVHPPWTTNFSNQSTGSAAPFAPWTSPSNYTGPVGWGDSYHIVQPPENLTAEPPRLELRTEATGIRILGSRTPSTQETAQEITFSVDKEAFDNITADSLAPPPTEETLVSVDGRSWGMHNLIMKAVGPARSYSVHGATIRTQLLSNASTWDQVPVSYEDFVLNGAPNPRFIVTDSESSRWRPENRRTAVNDGPSIVTELVAGNSSTITIPIPRGTTFVFINGTIGPDRGQALVKWNVPPPFFPSEGWYFSATCGWSAPAMLYAKYLDPDQEYNLTIQTLSSELHNITNIGLHMLAYYSASANEASTSEGAAPSTETATTSGRGKIIGGVVGGVLGALILVAIFAFFWFRRRRAGAKARTRVQSPNHRSPYIQEVDGASIHSTSSSQPFGALPPSYNPLWSTRVRPNVSRVLSSGDPLFAPLSPGLDGPSSGFVKLPQTDTTPDKATTVEPVTPLADYKQPPCSPRMRHVRAVLALLGSAVSGATAVNLGGGPADSRSFTLAHSDISDISISFDIDDASPLFLFHGAWEPEWSDTLGRQVHTTHGSEHASVELAVEGTGVALYGARDPPLSLTTTSTIGPDSAVSVRDGAGRLLPSHPDADGVLANVQNSPFDRVEATMEDQTSATYSVSGATIFTHIAGNTGSNNRVYMTSVRFAEDGKANEAFEWGGDWALGNGIDDDNGELVGVRGATVHVPVPAGSSFVVVRGTVGPKRGELVVEWDPPIANKRIDVSAKWSADTTLYLRRLDADTPHTFSLRADGIVGLHSVTFYTAGRIPRANTLAAETSRDFDQGEALYVSRILGGVVGGIGLLTLIAVLRACWSRKKRQEAEDEEARAAYTTYLGTRRNYETYHWAGGDGVASSSTSPAIGKPAHEGSEPETSHPTIDTHAQATSTSHAHDPPRPWMLHRTITSPQPIRTSRFGLYRTTSPSHAASSILLDPIHPITPTPSPGDMRPHSLATPPPREASSPGFPGTLDLSEHVHRPPRRVSFTSGERARPSRLAMESVQETMEDYPSSPVRRGSLSRFLDEPISRRLTHVGEPLARRISRATDQSEQDVWDDIGIAPPVSTAAVLEGRRASRSSTDRAVSVSEGRGRESLDSQRS